MTRELIGKFGAHAVGDEGRGLGFWIVDDAIRFPLNCE